jgi:hypothetical protein
MAHPAGGFDRKRFGRPRQPRPRRTCVAPCRAPWPGRSSQTSPRQQPAAAPSPPTASSGATFGRRKGVGTPQEPAPKLRASGLPGFLIRKLSLRIAIVAVRAGMALYAEGLGHPSRTRDPPVFRALRGYNENLVVLLSALSVSWRGSYRSTSLADSGVVRPTHAAKTEVAVEQGPFGCRVWRRALVQCKMSSLGDGGAPSVGPLRDCSS